MFMAAFAVLGLSTVNAQDDYTSYGFDEGNVIIEGGLGFSSTNEKATDKKTSLFNINPKVGYFMTEDLVLGVEVDFISEKEKIGSADADKISTIGAGVFARYYFLELGERFKTYTEFGVGFSSSKFNGDKLGSGIGAGLDLGMNYFLTEKMAISFGLADIISFNSNTPEGGKATSEFNANFNVFDNFFTTATFGLTFIL